MYRILTAVAFGLLAVAPQAEAAVPDSQPAATAPAQAPAKEKKVCRTDEATTGSIMRRRTCRTQAEWDARDKANRLQMDTRQMMNGSGGTAVR